MLTRSTLPRIYKDIIFFNPFLIFPIFQREIAFRLIPNSNIRNFPSKNFSKTGREVRWPSNELRDFGSYQRKEYGRIKKSMDILFDILFFRNTDSPVKKECIHSIVERGNRDITDNEISSVRSRGSRSRARSSIINVDWRRGPRGHPEDDSSSSHGACIRTSRVRSSSIYAEQFNDNGALRSVGGSKTSAVASRLHLDRVLLLQPPPPPPSPSSCFDERELVFWLAISIRLTLYGDPAGDGRLN